MSKQANKYYRNGTIVALRTFGVMCLCGVCDDRRIGGKEQARRKAYIVLLKQDGWRYVKNKWTCPKCEVTK